MRSKIAQHELIISERECCLEVSLGPSVNGISKGDFTHRMRFWISSSIGIILFMNLVRINAFRGQLSRVVGCLRVRHATSHRTVGRGNCGVVFISAVSRTFSSVNSQATYSIAPALLTYLQQSLNATVEQRCSADDRVDGNLAGLLHSRLINDDRYNSSNAVLSESGVSLCRAVGVLPSETLRQFASGAIDIAALLAEYQAVVDAGRSVFDTIQSHHRSMTAVDWENVTASTNALARYSTAASVMGARQWVIQGNAWMEEFAHSYFRFGGARRHYLDNTLNIQKMRFDSIAAKRAFVDRFPKDLMIRSLDEGNPSYDKIRLLDVGSCYNPIGRSERSAIFDVTALDLHPADPSVHQCDFLNLAVGEPGSAPVFDKCSTATVGAEGIGGHAQRLVRLPAASYDAVTMSLVLSYLPSPAQRIAMIRKARQLLSTPDRTSTAPHRTGLMLIAEKESIFSKAGDNHTQDTVGKNKSHFLTCWKRAIANEGFELVKYRVLRTDRHLSHVFAFATTPDEKAKEGSAEETQKSDENERPQMWIRQDFDPVYARTTESPLASGAALIDSDSELLEADGLVERGPARLHVPADLLQRPIGIVGGGIGGCALGKRAARFQALQM
jgi:hypothetical protein